MSERLRYLLFYSLVVLVALLLAYWFKTAPDYMMKILLYPQARATEIFYHIPLVYVGSMGYASPDGIFIIGPGCLGGNFILILFAMTACMFVKYFKGIYQAVWFMVCLGGALLVGTMVSTMRIIGSVPFAAHPKFPLFHAGIGISLYFLALTACYGILNKLIRGDIGEKNL